LENKRKRKQTFAYRPLDFCFFSGEVLGGRDSTEEGWAAGFPVFLLAGGKGDVGEKVEGTEPHLWVSLVRGEKVRGGGSTDAGGQGRNCSGAAALRRPWAEVAGLGSSVGAR